MRRLRDPGEAARLLAAGGVVLLPTDTVPGLHCRADDARAVERVRDLKGRHADQPLLLLCADVAQAFSFAATLAPGAEAYARLCWPGPFTLVLPRGAQAPVAVCTSGGSIASVACRVPDVAALRALVAQAGGALVSTSANRAGDPPATTLAEAAARFAEGVDAVLEAELTPGGGEGRSSALLDLTVWPPRVLREGPLPPPPWPQPGSAAGASS